MTNEEREKAKAYFQSRLEWHKENRYPYVSEQEAEIYKIALEALVQEPKTGKWKRISMDKYVQHAMAYYRCSECGKDIIGEHNYCPNCGVKMIESQESEMEE